MKRVLYTLIYFMLTYILAAPLTNHIYLDFTQTDWGNAATYGYWIFAPVIWACIACVLAAIGIGLAFIVAMAIDAKNARARAATLRDRAAKLARSIG